MDAVTDPHPTSRRSATLSRNGRGAAAPLDRVADFPAIPAGWAYLDTAATAQKPKPVIEAMNRAYAETYATVHRGVYQRTAAMTFAFAPLCRPGSVFIAHSATDEDGVVHGPTEAPTLVPQTRGGREP